MTDDAVPDSARILFLAKKVEDLETKFAELENRLFALTAGTPAAASDDSEPIVLNPNSMAHIREMWGCCLYHSVNAGQSEKPRKQAYAIFASIMGGMWVPESLFWMPAPHDVDMRFYRFVDEEVRRTREEWRARKKASGSGNVVALPAPTPDNVQPIRPDDPDDEIPF